MYRYLRDSLTTCTCLLTQHRLEVQVKPIDSLIRCPHFVRLSEKLTRFPLSRCLLVCFSLSWLLCLNKVLLCVVYVNSPSAHVRTKPCKSLTCLAFPKSLSCGRSWECFRRSYRLSSRTMLLLKSPSLVLTSARTPRSRGRSKFLTSQEDARLSLWFTS